MEKNAQQRMIENN